MNKKTAILIRKYSAEKGLYWRTIKRDWNRIPRRDRHTVRIGMELLLQRALQPVGS